MRKIRKRLFNRDIILQKLAEIGIATAEELLRTVVNLPMIFDRHNRIGTNPNFKEVSFDDLRDSVAWRLMLSRLKNEGLIYQSKSKKLVITEKGDGYVKNHLSWSKIYESEKSHNKELVLVIFDIPEKFKMKRDWLRFHLSSMGFRSVQKSVMWGECALPDDFLDDLKQHKMMSYVHLFSVNKKGSLSALFKRIGRKDLN